MEIPEILANTSSWVVVSKPPHWLTIPGRQPGSQIPILINWVKARFKTAQVVHRIDRETSGLVLMALTPTAHREANIWFQNRQVKKKYLGLASGTPQQPVFKCTDPIEGAPSTTQVEVLERFEGSFSAQFIPRTGRRHQIRIHLSRAGFPLLGDTLYSGPKYVSTKNGNIEIPRVALHSYELILPSGESFQAPLPTDLKNCLQLLRGEV